MVDPKDLKGGHSDRQIIEIRYEVGHQLRRFTE
jgi:hypothetical protein